MNFSKAIATCMGKYAVFSGRATRSEFWWFCLFTVLLYWFATLVENSYFLIFLEAGDLAYYESVPPWFQRGLIILVFLIPIFAASIRRLHDTDRSGWWWLLVITIAGIFVVVFWLASDTKSEDNKYGSVPMSHAA